MFQFQQTSDQYVSLRLIIFLALGIFLFRGSNLLAAEIGPDLGTLRVLKYHDLNENGRLDGTEEGLNGWTIELFNSDNTKVAEGITADWEGRSGYVEFIVPVGDYRVCETPQPYWLNSDPTDGSGCKQITVLKNPAIPGSSETTLTTPAGNSYDIKFEGRSEDGLTWTYHVTPQAGTQDLSHWDLGLCMAADRVAQTNPSYNDFNTDPTTGITGMKWESKGGTYSITFDTVYHIGTVELGVKSGSGGDNGQDQASKVAVGTIAGPICEEPVITNLAFGNIPLPNLIVTKTDLLIEETDEAVEDQGKAAPGEKIQYTITLTNDGPGDAKNVLLHDDLNPHFTLTQGDPFPLDLGLIPAGESKKIIFEILINDSLPLGLTQLCNQATVSGSNFDPLKSDDPDRDGEEDETCTPLEEGSLTIINTLMDQDVGTDPDFKFTVDGGLDNFALKLNQQEQKQSVPSGTYTLTEIVPTGWSLEKIVCFQNDTPFKTELDNSAVTLNLGVGEDITCNFFNRRSEGHLTLIQKTSPIDHSTLFKYQVNGTPSDGSHSPIEGFSLIHDQSFIAKNIPVGSYDIMQQLPDGWSSSDFNCSGGDIQPLTQGVRILLSDGDYIVCEVLSRKPGSLTIVTQAYEDDLGDNAQFHFTGTDDFTLAVEDSWTTTTLGEYRITEAVPPGWVLQNLICDNGVSFQRDNGTLIVELTGQATTCTFTNRFQRGDLIIRQQSDPADDTLFSFNSDIPNYSSFTLQDPSANIQKILDLPLGEYTISQQSLAGWNLEDINCTGGDFRQENNQLIVTVGDQAELDCLFRNHRPNSSIQVHQNPNKDSVYEPGEDVIFTLQIDNTGDDLVKLTSLTNDHYGDVASGANNDIKNTTCTLPQTLAPDNTYTCQFTAFVGGQAGETHLNTLTAQAISASNLSLEATDRVKIEILTLTGSMTIHLNTDPDGETGFNFESDLGQFTLADNESQSFAPPAGTYDFVETVPDGWFLTGINCSGRDYSATRIIADDTIVGVSITIQAGGSVDCTFGNTSSGSITIRKEANSTGNFDFSGGVVLGNFTLSTGGEKSFTHLAPSAVYEVREQVTPGWTLVNIECLGGTIITPNSDGTGVIIQLQAGENVVCTFVNSNSSSTETIFLNNDVEMGDMSIASNSSVEVQEAEETETGETVYTFTQEASYNCVAAQVTSYRPGTQKDGDALPTERSRPDRALGEPEEDKSLNFVSLGFGGELVLEFDQPIVNLNGLAPDIQVIESSFSGLSCEQYPENVALFASNDGINFEEIGQGCLDIDNEYDLAGLSQAKYLKLQDISQSQAFEGSDTDGFDVDGIRAICEE